MIAVMLAWLYVCFWFVLVALVAHYADVYVALFVAVQASFVYVALRARFAESVESDE